MEPISLLLASNGGDHQAYEKLLHWLSSHTMSQLRKYLSRYYNFPREAMDDIRQEVMITFHATHQTFDPTRPLVPWVNAIIRHKMIDFLRRKDFVVAMTSPGIEALEHIAAESGEDGGDREGLNKVLGQLNEKQLEILKLSKVEGYTSKEIAKQLNMSDSNVKVSLHRMLKTLKTLAIGADDKKE